LNILRKIKRRYRKTIWKSLRFFKKSITISTHQGVFKLPTGTRDPISKSLFVNKGYELDFFNEVMNLLQGKNYFNKGEGTIVDIGANNGAISIGALINGEVADAIAIEPDTFNFALLQENIKQNNLEHVFKTFNCAVSDNKSILQLELSKSNFGDHRIQKPTDVKELFKESKRKVVDIESDTLDSLLRDVDPKKISFIWADVQGHEGYVFQGAKNILAKKIPVVSEIWPYGIQRSGMSKKQFCDIVISQWSHYWVKQQSGFIQYSTKDFHKFLEKLGDKGDFDNVVFTS
jgi:FkbM family methyltransferase